MLDISYLGLPGTVLVLVPKVFILTNHPVPGKPEWLASRVLVYVFWSEEAEQHTFFLILFNSHGLGTVHKEGAHSVFISL